MNKFAKMYIMDKLSRQDEDFARDRNQGDWAGSQNDRGYDQARGNYDGRRDSNYDSARGSYDRNTDNARSDNAMDSGHGTYELQGQYDSAEDGARRRSKTTGRYIQDRGPIKLTKHDMARWKKMLRNSDGTRGEHFSPEQVKKEAERLGIRFDEYSEADLCMTMNMLYSDLCEVNRSLVSPDKEAYYYAKLAQAWLEDDDGPPGSEKLALYFLCIVDE